MTGSLLLWIAAGGAVGTVGRFLLSKGVQEATGSAFPYGTLAANVLGCLLIGFLAERLTGTVLLRDEHRLALLVGLLGGFTTFSTFGWETLRLLTAGQTGAAFLNILVSNVLGLSAVWAGWRLALAVGGP